MDKRNWLWKRKSSEKSPGGTDSSGSISSLSERYSDDQEAFKASPNDNTQSPEVTSKASVTSEEVNDSIKILTEKLSAALVNVSAKEDLVKQHSKVAEEAVAGWEKAENEVAVLKQQLEAAVQQNLLLEDRASHLDGALKECVRQLRQAKDHQEQKISEAILEKSREWEATKVELENQILLLQTEAEAAKALSSTVDPNIQMKMDSLERENANLKLELVSRSEELEIRIIERDLSVQAAENASKQHLESIKKVAKLEAECRRLQAVAKKSSSSYDQKSVSASSHYVDSLTDSQSDSGERLSALDIDSHKMSTLLSLSGKTVRKTIAGPHEIDIMDDFLEMERLAALSEKEIITAQNSEEVDSEKQCVEEENHPLKAELEEMTRRMEDLEEQLQNIEAEKDELQRALSASQDSLKASQGQLKEAETRIEELQKELNTVNESKELLEFQLIGMEVEARTVAVQVVTLKEEVEKEQGLSAKMTVRCQELEDELMRKSQEIELQQICASKANPKVKQEDLDVAAGKLAECQKTIASLGRQLQSLATLEDFLIDTANLPGFSGGGGGELWKLHSNDTFKTKNSSDPPQLPVEKAGPMVNGTTDKEPSGSSSSSTSSNSVGSSRRRNGLEKLFSRSKSGKLENQQA